MDHKVRTVSVIGMGFMGQQIARTASSAGFAVKAFDSDPQATEKSGSKLLDLMLLLDNAALKERFTRAGERVELHDTLAAAVAESDLVIEAVPESLELKEKVFSQIDACAPSSALLASNSSSIPVTKFETSVAEERMDKLLNVHFDSPMLDRPLVDIMPGTRTTMKTIETLRSWVESIGCTPVTVKKPIMGYLGNRLWRMVKREALMLWAEGYGDFQEIDRAWMLQFEVSVGPFGMMDVVGLDVVYDIEMAYYNETGDIRDRPPGALKEMLDRGDLGMKTGKGFYDWSDPVFLKPDFLRGVP